MANQFVTYLSDSENEDNRNTSLNEAEDEDNIEEEISELQEERDELVSRLNLINRIKEMRNNQKPVSKNYLEIDSTFRDRKLYKNSSEFTINVSQFGSTTDSTVAINPLSNAYPSYNFQGPNPKLLGGTHDDLSGNDTQFVNGSYPRQKFGGSNNTKNIYGAGNNSSPNLDGSFYNANQNISSTVNNYYNGMYLSRYRDQSGIILSNNFDSSGSIPNETVLINNYESFKTIQKYNDDISGNIVLSPSGVLQLVYQNGKNSTSLESEFNISDPSGWNTNNYWSINESNLLNVSNPQQIHIHGGSDVDDFYTGSYLEDCTLPLSNLPSDFLYDTPYDLSNKENRFKKIISYDGKTKIATITDKNNKIGFLAENSSTKKAIENNNFVNINMNGDWANTMSWWADISGTPVGIVHKGVADSSGSTGWIPQDRYRIRKDIPNVMGWGFNEDRNGARPRTGYNSEIYGDVTGGSTPLDPSGGINSELGYREFSGTGPFNGQNGAVIDFEIDSVQNGKNFVAGDEWVYYASQTNYANSPDLYNEKDDNNISNLYIRVKQIGENGEIIDAEVAWPCYGFREGQEVFIYNGDLSNTAKIIVKNVGQSIDISNGFLGKTTGNLSRIYNQYKNKIIYIPSKGPESFSSQSETKYNLTGYMNTNVPLNIGKNPEYINSLPMKYKNTSSDNIPEATGTANIKAYITSQAKFIKRNKNDLYNILNSNSPKLWEYETWNTLWSDETQTYGNISYSNENAIFKITSVPGFNKPQICGFVVSLSEGDYKIKLDYDLTGIASLFCRRWTQNNNLTNQGQTPDLFKFGKHMLQTGSNKSSTFEFTVPKTYDNFQRNSSYYVIGVVFAKYRDNDVNMTININDNITLKNVNISRNDNINIETNVDVYGSLRGWDTFSSVWSATNSNVTVSNGIVPNALQIRPLTNNQQYNTFLNNPNTSAFTQNPNGNYGYGFDNEENGEFGYKFTMNQDMVVTRLGRELWNLDISGNTTVNLWDVDYIDNSNINSFQFINGIDVSGMTVSVLYSNVDNTTDPNQIISLVNASNFPNSGTITIDNERIKYTAKTGNNLTNITRGTNPASHTTGTIVYFTPVIESTLLNTLLDTEVTSLDISDADDFLDFGTVKIGDEFINYTSKTNSTLSTLSRGKFETSASSHSSGATITQEGNVVYSLTRAVNNTIASTHTKGDKVMISGFKTFLIFNITSNQLTIPIDSSETLPNSGIVVINDEKVRYSNITDLNLINTTNLTSDVTNNSTVINVGSTTTFASSGLVLINNEIIQYTGKTETTLTGISRNKFFTDQSGHSINNNVINTYIENVNLTSSDESLYISGVNNINNKVLTVTDGNINDYSLYEQVRFRSITSDDIRSVGNNITDSTTNVFIYDIAGSTLQLSTSDIPRTTLKSTINSTALRVPLVSDQLFDRTGGKILINNEKIEYSTIKNIYTLGQSTLASDFLDTNTTSVSLVDAGDFPSSGYIRFGNQYDGIEIVEYSSKSSNNLTNITRGSAFTVKKTHLEDTSGEFARVTNIDLSNNDIALYVNGSSNINGSVITVTSESDLSTYDLNDQIYYKRFTVGDPRDMSNNEITPTNFSTGYIYTKSGNNIEISDTTFNQATLKFDVNSTATRIPITGTINNSGSVLINSEKIQYDEIRTLYSIGENTLDYQTELSVALATDGTNIQVVNASDFPSSGNVLIDNEIIAYSTKSGNQLQNITKASNFTTTASHDLSGNVKFCNVENIDLSNNDTAIYTIASDISGNIKLGATQGLLSGYTANTQINYKNFTSGDPRSVSNNTLTNQNSGSTAYIYDISDNSIYLSNSQYKFTTINETLSSSDLRIKLTANPGFSSSGVVRINDELIQYSSIQNLYTLGESPLSSNVTNTSTTINLDDSYELANTGHVLIDNEIISYNANDKTNNRLTINNRRENFTLTLDHNTDTNCRFVNVENVDLSNNDAALYVYGDINNTILTPVDGNLSTYAFNTQINYETFGVNEDPRDLSNNILSIHTSPTLGYIYDNSGGIIEISSQLCPNTTILENLTNTDLRIQIANSSQFNTSGGKIRIDDEIIQYSSILNLYSLGQTTLSQNITTTDISFNTVDAYDFRDTSGHILINNEIIEYTGVNKTTNKFTTTLQKRGDNFTTVSGHNSTNIIKFANVENIKLTDASIYSNIGTDTDLITPTDGDLSNFTSNSAINYKTFSVDSRNFNVNSINSPTTGYVYDISGGKIQLASSVYPTTNLYKAITTTDTRIQIDSSENFLTSGKIRINNEVIGYDSIARYYDIGQTTLNGNLSNSATSISLTDAYEFATSGYILINNEVVSYTGKTNNTITGVTRAVNFSSAVSHIDTDTATHVNVANIDLSNNDTAIYVNSSGISNELLTPTDGVLTNYTNNTAVRYKAFSSDSRDLSNNTTSIQDTGQYTSAYVYDNSGGKIILSDDQYANTTIRINITSTTSKIPLLSSTGFASSGTARIGDERITYTSIVNQSLTGESTLSNAITNSATSIALADASDFANSGKLKLSNEIVSYTGKTDNTITGITRGVNFTDASGHASSLNTQFIYPENVKITDAALYVTNTGISNQTLTVASGNGTTSNYPSEQAIRYKAFSSDPRDLSNNITSIHSSGQYTDAYIYESIGSNVTITTETFSGTSSYLTSELASSATSLTLNSATNFTATAYVKINNEIIKFTSVSGNNLQSLTRGISSTTAVTHPSGTRVFLIAADSTTPIAVSSGDSRIPVSDSSDFPNNGNIRIGSESLSYQSKSTADVLYNTGLATDLTQLSTTSISTTIAKTLNNKFYTTSYLPFTQTIAPAADRTVSSQADTNRNGTASRITSHNHWRAGSSNTSQWLTLNLGTQMSIAGIITKSGAGRSEYVKTALVDISNDNSNWTNVDSGATFTLNTEADTAVSVAFAASVTAQYVKIRPQTWQTAIEMRADVLLPNTNNNSIILNNTTSMKATDGEVRITKSDDSIHKIKYGSLASTLTYGVYNYSYNSWSTTVVAENSRTYSSVYNNNTPGTGWARSTINSADSWRAATNNTDQWITMDAGSVQMIAGVVTQGRNTSGDYIRDYYVDYSTDNTNWTNANNADTFIGNKDRHTLVYGIFTHPVSARYIKIKPKSWRAYIIMRCDIVLAISSGAPTAVSTTIPLDVSGSATSIPLTSDTGLRTSGTNNLLLGNETISYTGIASQNYTVETTTTLSAAITNTLQPSRVPLIQLLALSTDASFNTLYIKDNTTYSASVSDPAKFLIDNERVSYTGYGSAVYTGNPYAAVFASKTTATEITSTSTKVSLNNLTDLPSTGEVYVNGERLEYDEKVSYNPDPSGTTLSGNLTADSSANIVLADGSQFAPADGMIQIGTEYILYETRTNNTLSGITRAFQSNGMAHASGATVNFRQIAYLNDEYYYYSKYHWPADFNQSNLDYSGNVTDNISDTSGLELTGCYLRNNLTSTDVTSAHLEVYFSSNTRVRAIPSVGILRLDNGTNTEDIAYYGCSVWNNRGRVDMSIRKWNFTTEAWEYSRSSNTRYAFSSGSSGATLSIVGGSPEKNVIKLPYLPYWVYDNAPVNIFGSDGNQTDINGVAGSVSTPGISNFGGGWANCRITDIDTTNNTFRVYCSNQTNQVKIYHQFSTYKSYKMWNYSNLTQNLNRVPSNSSYYDISTPYPNLWPSSGTALMHGYYGSTTSAKRYGCVKWTSKSEPDTTNTNSSIIKGGARVRLNGLTFTGLDISGITVGYNDDWWHHTTLQLFTPSEIGYLTLTTSGRGLHGTTTPTSHPTGSALTMYRMYPVTGLTRGVGSTTEASHNAGTKMTHVGTGDITVANASDLSGASLPLIKIGNEFIGYDNKSTNTLEFIKRGRNNSPPEAHSQNDTVTLVHTATTKTPHPSDYKYHFFTPIFDCSDISGQVFNVGATATLQSSLTNSREYMYVNYPGAYKLPPRGVVQIDDEQISYKCIQFGQSSSYAVVWLFDNQVGSYSTTSGRGHNSTTAASHSSGATITLLSFPAKLMTQVNIKNDFNIGDNIYVGMSSDLNTHGSQIGILASRGGDHDASYYRNPQTIMSSSRQYFTVVRATSTSFSVTPYYSTTNQTNNNSNNYWGEFDWSIFSDRSIRITTNYEHTQYGAGDNDLSYTMGWLTSNNNTNGTYPVSTIPVEDDQLDTWPSSGTASITGFVYRANSGQGASVWQTRMTQEFTYTSKTTTDGSCSLNGVTWTGSNLGVLTTFWHGSIITQTAKNTTLSYQSLTGVTRRLPLVQSSGTSVQQWPLGYNLNNIVTGFDGTTADNHASQSTVNAVVGLSINGTNLSLFSSSGYIKIGNEVMKYASKNGNTFQLTERGYNFTNKLAHANAASITDIYVANVDLSNNDAALYITNTDINDQSLTITAGSLTSYSVGTAILYKTFDSSHSGDPRTIQNNIAYTGTAGYIRYSTSNIIKISSDNTDGNIINFDSPNVSGVKVWISGYTLPVLNKTDTTITVQGEDFANWPTGAGSFIINDGSNNETVTYTSINKTNNTILGASTRTNTYKNFSLISIQKDTEIQFLNGLLSNTTSSHAENSDVTLIPALMSKQNFNANNGVKIWKSDYTLPTIATDTSNITVVGDDINNWPTGAGSIRFFDGSNNETVTYTSIDKTNKLIQGIANRTNTYKNYSLITRIPETADHLIVNSRGVGTSDASGHSINTTIREFHSTEMTDFSANNGVKIWLASSYTLPTITTSLANIPIRGIDINNWPDGSGSIRLFDGSNNETVTYTSIDKVNKLIKGVATRTNTYKNYSLITYVSKMVDTLVLNSVSTRGSSGSDTNSHSIDSSIREIENSSRILSFTTGNGIKIWITGYAIPIINTTDTNISVVGADISDWPDGAGSIRLYDGSNNETVTYTSIDKTNKLIQGVANRTNTYKNYSLITTVGSYTDNLIVSSLSDRGINSSARVSHTNGTFVKEVQGGNIQNFADVSGIKIWPISGYNFNNIVIATDATTIPVRGTDINDWPTGSGTIRLYDGTNSEEVTYTSIDKTNKLIQGVATRTNTYKNYTLITNVANYNQNLIVVANGRGITPGPSASSHTNGTTIRQYNTSDILTFSGSSGVKVWGSSYTIPVISTSLSNIPIIGNDINDWPTGAGKIRFYDGSNNEIVTYTSIDKTNKLIQGVATRTNTYKNYTLISNVGENNDNLIVSTDGRGSNSTIAASHTANTTLREIDDTDVQSFTGSSGVKIWSQINYQTPTITTNQTTINVFAGDISNWPSSGNILFYDGTNSEIVAYTGKSGTQLTGVAARTNRYKNYTLMITIGEYVQNLMITSTSQRGIDETTATTHLANAVIREIDGNDITFANDVSGVKIWKPTYVTPTISGSNDILVKGTNITDWPTGGGTIRLFNGTNFETIEYTSIDKTNNLIKGLVGSLTNAYKNYSLITLETKVNKQLIVTDNGRGVQDTTASSHNIGAIVFEDKPASILKNNVTNDETTYIVMEGGHNFPPSGILLINDEQIQYRMIGSFLQSTGTNDALGTVDNSIYAFDSLRSTLSNTGTTIELFDTTRFSSRGTVTIDSEQIRYTGKTSTQLTGCVRSSNGTTNVQHTAGVIVTENKSTNLTQQITISGYNSPIQVWNNDRYSQSGIIKINNELISYEDLSGVSQFIGLRRGINGTTVSVHDINSVVIQVERRSQLASSINKTISTITLSNAQGWSPGTYTTTTVPLNGNITTSVTTINTTSSTSLFDTSGIIIIGNEYMQYSSKTNTSFTISNRGYNGTTATTHNDGSTIILYERNYLPDTSGSITITDLSGNNYETVSYTSIDYSNNQILGVANRINVYPSGAIVSQRIINVPDTIQSDRNVSDVSGIVLTNAIINSSSTVEIKTDSAWASTTANAIALNDTSITVADNSSFFVKSGVTYSALIGTYPSNYEIITYTGKGTNTLTGVTKGASGTTKKTWANGSAIIQCSGWAWTTLSSPVTLLQNNSYYITLSSVTGMDDPWRFGSWNQILGNMWPASPTYNKIPDYENGSSNSNINTSLATYKARVYSRTRATGTGRQNINSFPDENTDSLENTGWPIVNFSSNVQQSQKTNYSVTVNVTDDINNTTYSKAINLTKTSDQFVKADNIKVISQYATTKYYNGYNRFVVSDDVDGTLAINQKMIMNRGWTTDAFSYGGDNMSVEFSPSFDYSIHEKSDYGYGIIGLSSDNLYFNNTCINYGFGFGNYGGSYDNAMTITYGTQTDLSNNSLSNVETMYLESINKYVVISQDSNRVYCNLYTIIGDQLSLNNSPVELSSSAIGKITMCFDDINNRLHVFYHDSANNNQESCITGSIVNSVITFNTKQIYNDSNLQNEISCEFDPNTEKVIVFYINSSNVLCSKVGAYSAELEFGSEQSTSIANVTTISSYYDPTNKSIALLYIDPNNGNFVTLNMCTINGSNVNYGTAHVINYNSSINIDSCYISNGRGFVLTQDDDNDNVIGHIINYQNSEIKISEKSEIIENVTWAKKYKGLSCVYDSSFNRIITGVINASSTVLINTGTVCNTSDIVMHKALEYSLPDVSGTFININYDSDNYNIISVYSDTLTSRYKYRVNKSISEIYSGLAIYENGSRIFTDASGGYYSRNDRYKVKYDNTNSLVRYYKNDLEIYSSTAQQSQSYFFKFAHSRKGVNGTSPIQRTYNCVAGINASLNTTVLDLKLSRYNIFNGQTHVGKIIPTTFNDMEINGSYTVNSDNFYVIDDDLYLTNSANYDNINLYEIVINHENSYGNITKSKNITINVVNPELNSGTNILDIQMNQDLVSDGSGDVIPIHITSEALSDYTVTLSGTDTNYFNILDSQSTDYYNASGIESVGAYTSRSSIKMLASQQLTTDYGITSKVYGISSNDYSITLDAETNSNAANGIYLHVSEVDLSGNSERILISKLANNPLQRTSELIKGDRTQKTYYFKAIGSGFLRVNVLFLSTTNQNDYAIIHNIKLTQQNITIPWKLTNDGLLNKYLPNTISKGIVGDLCASNGLGIVIIDTQFSTPVTGNKYDGSYSRYTLDGSYNRIDLGENVNNSYNWEIIDCNQDGVQNLVTTNIDSDIVNIRLKSLIIPNVNISSSNGGKITDYSHLFIQLNEVASNIPGVISSTNPNTNTSLFKISIKNISNLSDSKFIVLNGDDEIQIIKFNQSSDLYIKIYLPDGDLIKFEESEHMPPLNVNKELQITTLFEIIQ